MPLDIYKITLTVDHVGFREFSSDFNALVERILPKSRYEFLEDVRNDFMQLHRDAYEMTPPSKMMVHESTGASKSAFSDSDGVIRDDLSGFDWAASTDAMSYDLGITLRGKEPYWPNGYAIQAWIEEKTEAGNGDFYTTGGAKGYEWEEPVTLGSYSDRTSESARAAFAISRHIAKEGQSAFSPNPIDVVYNPSGGLSDQAQISVDQAWERFKDEVDPVAAQRTSVHVQRAMTQHLFGEIPINIPSKPRTYTRKDGGVTLVLQGRGAKGRFTSPLGNAGVIRLDALGRVIS